MKVVATNMIAQMNCVCVCLCVTVCVTVCVCLMITFFKQQYLKSFQNRLRNKKLLGFENLEMLLFKSY